MPRVSVVVPTHNRADLVCETIDSVLAQTYRDFEVIVVDDGSSDETPAVLAAYRDRIRVIRQPNQGVSSARNAGIGAATGEFVAFLDSDDLWLPTKLERQVALLDEDAGLGLVYSDGETFDGETSCPLALFSQANRLYQGDVLHQLFVGNFISTPTPIVRRCVLDETGEFFDNEVVAEDWDMWLRIAARYPVGLIAEPLVRRRVHEGMKTIGRPARKQYDRCVRTIERAISREPESLARLKNQAVANIALSQGRVMVSAGDAIGARRMFARAIRYRPLEVPAYGFWLVTLLSRRFWALLAALNHWRRGI